MITFEVMPHESIAAAKIPTTEAAAVKAGGERWEKMEGTNKLYFQFLCLDTVKVFHILSVFQTSFIYAKLLSTMFLNLLQASQMSTAPST